MRKYNIISWNVNSYRDEIHEWFKIYIEENKPDIIFLSETKRKKSFLEEKFGEFKDYNYIINVHTPATYHGVAFLIKKDIKYVEIDTILDICTRKDTKSNNAACGRIINILVDNETHIVGAYIPNSGNKDEIKHNYRVKIWDPCMYDLLNNLVKEKNVIWLGDLNVALDNIDVSNIKTMAKYAGFTKEERSNFKNFIDSNGWIDAWRIKNPDVKKYTWVGRTRKPNYGMRIDNIIISKSLIDNLIDANIVSNSHLSSDHVIINIDILI